ncbi:hypothetical protein GCM10023161_05820 [Mycobacterium paraffinicum]|uniref:Uncharacterized protein n=1 Tax=Mycobacterium paraffinicum TaxID=53378 RepID=A0ABP8RBL1_9MYCO
MVLAIPRQHHFRTGLQRPAGEIVDEFDGQERHVDGADEGEAGAGIGGRAQCPPRRRQRAQAAQLVAHDPSVQFGQWLPLGGHDKDWVATLLENADDVFDHRGCIGAGGSGDGQARFVAPHPL